ncbi:HAD family hydrolase [Streptomyces sp. FH025]|uniref:HAD family hydrolase n=1 Tax=Streptomyces sp. FH025 TaxID=2815937 RepID=UPI001FAEC2D2|nr:HAD family hydrolase [Streptomyces sp. FH025]
MPLLLFDLDNTLLPRDAAFRAWAQDFLSEHHLPLDDLDWFVTLDGGGYVPRSTVLSAVRRRYGLDASVEFLLAHFRRGINSHIHCPPRNIEALRSARTAGWTLGIVSNGGTRAQLEKIRRTGLGPLVDGWVISEEADCVKPDPLIFEIAARRCGIRPTGDWAAHTWMVGDHAPADIAGAELAGLRSVWLHHGRPWAETGYRPTLKAAGLPEAVGLVLSARNAPSARPDARTGGPVRRRAAAGPVRTTAVLGARSGARLTASAPDGPSAPVPMSGGTAGASGFGAGPGVRNRSGGFAAIADGRQSTAPRTGATAEAGTNPGADAGRAAAVARATPLRTAADGAPPARTAFASAPAVAATVATAVATAVTTTAAAAAAAVTPLAAKTVAPVATTTTATAAAPTTATAAAQTPATTAASAAAR